MDIEINGVALQVDFMDAGFMETFEPALYAMRDGINESKAMKGSVAAGYRAINKCVEDFFNVVFGDGTAGQVFQGSQNVMAHLEAVADMDKAYRAERKQFNDFSNRYTQRQNSFQTGQMQGHRQKQKPHSGRP